MVIGNTPGTSLALAEERIRGYKNFANKLWNIARFILENTKGETMAGGFPERNKFDETLRTERRALLKDVTGDMENLRFHLAAEKLYHYVWHNLADKVLEESKVIFEKGNEEEKARRRQFLLHTLDKILKALHPFMPFVTEEIWSMMPMENKSLLM